MAHDYSDLRLRRAPIGKADPPVGTVLGADTILAPIEVERGLPHGTSNPDAGDAHLDLEHDSAEGQTTSKAGSPPATPTPFTFTK
jgi:hypothetical protein